MPANGNWLMAPLPANLPLPLGVQPRSGFTGSWASSGTGFRFEDLQGIVPQDAFNPAGILSVVPADWSQLNTYGVTNFRWHSGGLRLTPGTPVRLRLQQWVFQGEPYKGQWIWENVPGADGTIVLEPNTRLVGVEVILLGRRQQQSSPAEFPNVSRQDAEAWFDGRTVDTLTMASSNGGSASVQTIDRIPRSALTDQALQEQTGPSIGGSPFTQIFAQQPDAIWSFCGETYNMNIQWRMTRFAQLDLDNAQDPTIPNTCRGRSLTSGMDPIAFQNCLNAWVTAGQVSSSRIAVFVTQQFQGTRGGLAQAGSNGIVISINNLSTTGIIPGPAVIAHELGHTLGGFLDEPSGNNLMSNGSRFLRQEQCATAFANALRFQTNAP